MKHLIRQRTSLRYGKLPADRRGFTLVELLIVVAIIGILAAIAIPSLKNMLIRAKTNALAGEARTVLTAFKQFYIDNGMYPNCCSNPAFNLVTFDPLRSEGYYRGNINRLLLNQKADAFDSPDDQGTNQEFWLELSLAADPSVRILVADSDNAPLGGGQWFDGVYLFRNGVLSPL